MNTTTKIFSTSKVPFFILLFFCFASAILGDSLAEALILSHYSAAVIPRMYMVNAVFLFLSSLFVMSLIDRVDRGLFFLIFTVIHCIILFLVWCAVSFGITFLFIPLFSYSYITKIFLFLMFWTLANDIIDSRSAGKAFPFIAAGGTLGAIGVSFMIPWLLKVMPAKSLLLVWIALSVVILFFFLPIRRSFGKLFKPVSDSEKHATRNIKSLINDISLVNREPLLANMSILYFLIFFVLFNQQYSFYEVIKARFVETERLAGFLGYFNGTSMFLTFFLQITIAGIVIKKMGSTRSMFMLPFALCVVFGALVILGFTSSNQQITTVAFGGLFWGIAGGVGLRIAFFDSFFSPNFQIFFSSLPRDIRGRGKLVIEGVVKPAAMVFASLWLLFITSKIPFSVNMTLLFVISVLMIFQTFRIRSKYTERLSQYLVGFKSRASLSFLNPAEITDSKDIISFLSDKLVYETYEIKCYIIEMLTDINSEESIRILTDYVYIADTKTRATIISSLARLKLKNLKPIFSTMLQDSDHRVAANSIYALAALNDPEINEGLRAFLLHENNRIKINTVISLWPASKPIQRKRLLSVIEEMLDSEDTDNRTGALFAIGELKSLQETAPLLKQFYNRRKEIILSDREIWHHYLQTVGKNPNEELINVLFELAAEVGKKKRNDIVSSIVEACRNGYSIENFLIDLKSKNVITRGIILKVLCAQEKFTISKEMEQNLIDLAQDEAVFTYDTHLSYRVLINEKENSIIQLFAWVIFEECTGSHLENLTYIAAILDRSGQVKKVIRRLNHKNIHVRARAFEVLDNIGNSKINRSLIRLIDKYEKFKKGEKIPGSFPADSDSVTAIVNSYTDSPVKWVSECASYALAMCNA